jgi:hypothetical protein
MHGPDSNRPDVPGPIRAPDAVMALVWTIPVMANMLCRISGPWSSRRRAGRSGPHAADGTAERYPAPSSTTTTTASTSR